MNLPPYHTFPNIPGDKISLRQVLMPDLKDLVEISFYDAVQAATIEQAQAMQEKINQDYQDGNSIHWVIEDLATHRIVGTCGYYRGFDGGAGELGCVLLPAFRGQGFMTPALQLAIDFGLIIMGLHRIWAITTQQNSKAVKLLDRLGFVEVKDLPEDEIEYEVRMEV